MARNKICITVNQRLSAGESIVGRRWMRNPSSLPALLKDLIDHVGALADTQVEIEQRVDFVAG